MLTVWLQPSGQHAFMDRYTNPPCVGSRSGTAQEAALLTKWGETAIIKTERALLLAVGSTRFAQIDYADRSVAAGRSARFYGKCQC